MILKHKSAYLPSHLLNTSCRQLCVCVQAMESLYKTKTDEGKKAVIAAGGLHVIGTERHESRRIDNQLRGRSGRWASSRVLLLCATIAGANNQLRGLSDRRAASGLACLHCFAWTVLRQLARTTAETAPRQMGLAAAYGLCNTKMLFV